MQAGALLAAASGSLLRGLTLIILRLQLGAWFKTGYELAPSIRPEAPLRLSWPTPCDRKYGVPLATGSYCWWPVAPALGVAGLVRGARRPRAARLVHARDRLARLVAFYFFVEFGRGDDDGLGPRYALPVVVPMASAAPRSSRRSSRGRWRAGPVCARGRGHRGPALAAAAVIYGVARIAPLMYPIAHDQYVNWTAPLRGARKMQLKNAIVIIEPGRVPAHETNLAQNPPMTPIRRCCS